MSLALSHYDKHLNRGKSTIQMTGVGIYQADVLHEMRVVIEEALNFRLGSQVAPGLIWITRLR